MILRRLRVEGFRAHAEPIELGPFSERLNVIHGPNKTGKSTLFLALVRCLMDRHRAGGDEFEGSVRPWGRFLTPTIVVEFGHAGSEFRIEKRFLHERSSKLFRLEDARFRPLSEGDAADAKLLEILGAVAAPKGASQPEHWGLAQVLWAQQGKLEIPAGKGGLPDAIVDRIRASLGAHLAGPGADRILDKIVEAFKEVYTETGRLKKAAEIHKRTEQLEAARAAVEAARSAHEQFEAASRRVSGLKAERERLAARLETLDKDLQAAQVAAEAFNTASNRKKELEREIKDRQVVHDDLEALRKARAESERWGKELPSLETSAKVCTDRLAAAETALKRARKVSEDAAAFDKERATASEAGETLEFLRRIDGKLEELARKLRELRAPDPKTLDALRKAFHARDVSATRLEGSLVTLEVLPEREIDARIVAGDGPKAGPAQGRLRPGEPFVVRGSPEVAVDLAGIARVRARGPAGSAEEHHAALQRALQEIKKLTSVLGAGELAGLEALRGEAAEIESEINTLNAVGFSRLNGRRRENLEAIVQEFLPALDRWCGTYPEWRACAPDTEKLRGEAERLEESLGAAREAHRTAAAKESEARGVRDRAQDQTIELERRLQGPAGGLLDDWNLAELASRTALEWKAARGEVEKVEAELKAIGGDPVRRVKDLYLSKTDCEALCGTARDDEKLEEGALKSFASRSVYTALAEAEERLALAEEAYVRERVSAEAIKLLRDTVEDCRNEMQASVAAPVEEAAGAILDRIAGQRLGSLRLAGNFVPENIALAGDSVDAPVEELSGGEAEQLHFATRMALAEVLAREERQLVVLDDVLIATDATRLGRALEVIAEAADRLQILILTCHPERYEGLRRHGEANYIDLESVKAEGAVRGRSR